MGTMAGQVIMQGFMNFKISVFLRRLVTMIPAIIVVVIFITAATTCGIYC